jgi:hypothetical protein
LSGEAGKHAASYQDAVKAVLTLRPARTTGPQMARLWFSSGELGETIMRRAEERRVHPRLCALPPGVRRRYSPHYSISSALMELSLSARFVARASLLREGSGRSVVSMRRSHQNNSPLRARSGTRPFIAFIPPLPAVRAFPSPRGPHRSSDRRAASTGAPCRDRRSRGASL